MRISLLGAGSPTGRLAARDLSDLPEVELSTAPAEGPFEEALHKCDVAVGCFESDVAAEERWALASIEARVPYLSSSQSPEAFQALTELDERASDAGSLVVAGLSWSPGLTNLIAALGARELDEVEEVKVAWTGSCLGPLGRDLLSRAIRAFSGDAVVFENNTWRLEQAGSGREDVFFPEPAGWRPVALCAAAEPLSIPEFMPGVKKVSVKGGVTEKWGQSMALRAADPWGASPAHPMKLPPISKAAASVLSRVGKDLQAWSAGRVDVTGPAGGETRTVTYGFVDQLPNLLTAPLLAGALLAGGEALSQPGVLAPEQAFDPEAFFELTGRRGVRLARLHPSDQERQTTMVGSGP